ncbi:MAG TPA: DUF362 domain-containing protein [Desulfitobacteriaceae bacterium]|nr:DUF362 domain-containing protein [Desulfitobacteriaceae bacterium]
MKKVIMQKAEANIKASVEKLILELGGFERFVKAGETVLIKPNYNTADPPPASTALDFLQATVELCFEAGAGKVIVGESSTVTMYDHSLFTKKILCEACVYDLEKLPKPPEVYIFDDHEWVKKYTASAKYIKKVSLPRIIDEVDKIILLPCCKTHFIAQYTGALKLIVGFMKPSERIKLHMGHEVPEKVAEMNTVYKPDLVIMDARKCFINGGPGKGEFREPGLILASEGRVAIDIEEVKIIQSFEGNSLARQKPEELRQIKYAKELGIE